MSAADSDLAETAPAPAVSRPARGAAGEADAERSAQLGAAGTPTAPYVAPEWGTTPLPVIDEAPPDVPFEVASDEPRPSRTQRIWRSRAWLVVATTLGWIVALGALAATLAVAWWLLTPQLGKPYVYDEADFALAGRAVAQTGLPLANVGHIQEETPGDFSKQYNWALWHPPLYVYLLGSAFARWGESEVTARTLGVACSAIATVLIFLAGTVLLSGRTRAAPLYAAAGAAVYALNPLVLQSALLLDIDGTVLVASIALLTLAYALLFRLRRSLRHPVTFLLLGLITFSFALSLWAKMTTALALVAAATLVRLLVTRPWRPLRVVIELPLVGLVGGALFLGSWWAFSLFKGMPFWFPFRILQLEFGEAAGSTAAWRDNPQVVLQLASQVALWVSPYLILLFAWAGLARLYDLLLRPFVTIGRRLLHRPAAGEGWGAWGIDFVLVSGAAIAAAYLIKLAGSFPKYHVSMMPLWAIAVAYLLYRYVPSLSWWEIPVYGVVTAGMAGYFVSFVGDRYILFNGWDFVFPLLVWPAALGFAFFVLGAALGKHHLPRQLTILGVMLTLGWSWGVDLAQARADYSTAYNYRTNGQRDTAAFLNQILRPGEVYVAPRDVAYYVRADHFIDQDVWQAEMEEQAAYGSSDFGGQLRLGSGASYDVRTVAVFLWDPALSQEAHSFLDTRYDKIYESGPAGPYFVFQRVDP